MIPFLVLVYVASVIAANSAVAAFGPGVSVLTAFALIGLNITTRDRLHDLWRGQRLALRMALLIVGTSALSALVNPATGRIALASTVAFGLSETVDALTYHGLRRRPWFVRANGSNLASAALDSLVFPTLAFGALLPVIVLGQFLAKTIGGFMWSVLLRSRRVVGAVAVLALLAIPATAQIVSVDAGAMWVAGTAKPVAEVFVASPAVAGFRAFAISTLRLGATDLSYQTQLTRTVLASRHGFLSVQGGALFLAFRDYRPWGIIGAQATVFIPGTRLSLIGVASTTPADDWSRTYLLKLSATGFFGR